MAPNSSGWEYIEYFISLSDTLFDGSYSENIAFIAFYNVDLNNFFLSRILDTAGIYKIGMGWNFFNAQLLWIRNYDSNTVSIKVSFIIPVVNVLLLIECIENVTNYDIHNSFHFFIMNNVFIRYWRTYKFWIWSFQSHSFCNDIYNKITII